MGSAMMQRELSSSGEGSHYRARIASGVRLGGREMGGGGRAEGEEEERGRKMVEERGRWWRKEGEGGGTLRVSWEGGKGEKVGISFF